MSKHQVRAARRTGLSKLALKQVLGTISLPRRGRITAVLETPVRRPLRSDVARDALRLDLVVPSQACTEFRCVESAVEEILFPPEE